MSAAGTILTEVAADATAVLPYAETLAGVLLPGSVQTVALVVKIAQGVAAAVPEAVSLYNTFVSGGTPTQAQIDAFAAAETGSYNKLMADIKAAEATAT